MIGKSSLEAGKQRLEALRKKRQQMKDTMNTSQSRLRADNQEIKREFSTQKSETVHVVGSIIETYEKQVQCALQTRSLDSRPPTQVQEDEDTFKELDFLQLKQHKRRKDENRQTQDNIPIKVKQLDPQEANAVIESKNFHEFLNHSSKTMEDVLEQGDDDLIKLLLKGGLKEKQNQNDDILAKVSTFHDPHFTQNRVVTDLDWSSQISELFLASYSKNEEGSIKDHVGIVLIWSAQLRSRPEFYCFCQSAVTAAKFFPYSTNTVIGGCSNGTLLLWDVRAKAMPVQRSSISSEGHRYPITSLNVVGTQIANNIVSFSTDGTMSLWDVRQLSRPVRNPSRLTVNKPPRSSKPTSVQSVLTGRSSVTSSSMLERSRVDEPLNVSVTCCQFPLGDANKYYAGSLNGVMYRNATHNSSAENVTAFDEHDGPISGISINNPSSEHQALSSLVLTSSYDWTVKLWSPESKDSLRTFEHSDDYIYDVCWNPSNPSLFATANNDGIVDIFDLTKDVEQPVVHKKINQYALNKCKWNGDGSVIACGDTEGNLYLSVLDEKYRRIDNNRLEDFEKSLIQTREQSRKNQSK